MDFDKIILCTEAPKNSGLAYYYYLAFKDILPEDKVVLIDEGDRKYDASLFYRIDRRLNLLRGKSSIEKMQLIFDNCGSSKKNIVILFNTANLRYNEIKKLSQQSNIYLIHLLSDNPYGMYESRKNLTINSLGVFDMICVFSNALVPVLYQLGALRVERIPFGYCRYTHFISNKNELLDFPKSVYYFGTWTPIIEKWLSHLKVYDINIEGGLWKNSEDKTLRKIGTKLNSNTEKNMAIMARKAGVVINFTRANHGCFHTMKTFELTAAGACVVSNYSEEQAEFFKPDQSMTYFNTPDEMVEKVRLLLADKGKNMLLRKNAIEAANHHDYHNRAEEILSLID